MPINAPTRPRQCWITTTRFSRWASIALFPAAVLGEIISNYYLCADAAACSTLFRFAHAERSRVVSCASESLTFLPTTNGVCCVLGSSRKSTSNQAGPSSIAIVNGIW